VPILYRGNLYAREFTVGELAKIQGFPDGYAFCGNKNDKITQIGNAVPPALSKAIALQTVATDELYR